MTGIVGQDIRERLEKLEKLYKKVDKDLWEFMKMAFDAKQNTDAQFNMITAINSRLKSLEDRCED